MKIVNADGRDWECRATGGSAKSDADASVGVQHHNLVQVRCKSGDGQLADLWLPRGWEALPTGELSKLFAEKLASATGSGLVKLKWADHASEGHRVTHIVRRSDDGSMLCRGGSPEEHGRECPIIPAVDAFIAKNRQGWDLNWTAHAEQGVTLAIVGSARELVRVQRSVL